jgi:hypothetical protein
MGRESMVDPTQVVTPSFGDMGYSRSVVGGILGWIQ